jgi:hypothetical protein
MNWTEKIPTVSGWYWQKDPDGCKRIILLPHCGVWPTPWEERKAAALSAADNDEMRTKLDRLNWKVLWAGPIPEPKD